VEDLSRSNTEPWNSHSAGYVVKAAAFPWQQKPQLEINATSPMATKTLSPRQREELLTKVRVRFEKYTSRHSDIPWVSVEERLNAAGKKLWSLSEMERTGGEPDVVGRDKKTGDCIFFDCSAESPPGRRSLCYDRLALESATSPALAVSRSPWRRSLL